MGMAAAIEALIDSTAGQGVLSRGAVDACISAETATVLVAERDPDGTSSVRPALPGDSPDEAVIGVSIARDFASPAALSEHPYVHSDPTELASRVGLANEEFPVGSVMVSCVATEHQGAGLGGELTRRALGTLQDADLTSVLQLEWDRPDSPGVEKLKAAGCTPVARLENYFPTGWNCRACGSGPSGEECTCDVVAFIV